MSSQGQIWKRLCRAALFVHGRKQNSLTLCTHPVITLLLSLSLKQTHTHARTHVPFDPPTTACSSCSFTYESVYLSYSGFLQRQCAGKNDSRVASFSLRGSGERNVEKPLQPLTNQRISWLTSGIGTLKCVLWARKKPMRRLL